MEGVLIPIVSVVGFFTWLLARSPVGRAYADRLRAGTAPGLDRAEHASLMEAVDALRREVAELSERMDFAERLLARGGDRGEGNAARIMPGGSGA
ncbi:MAG TPA: hypothetical protein VLT79_03380 [Gemmatimonadales bacterium]|nr:hypothetical protein [Gemmatimonadales bacterium]